ncbi:DUF3140 domain-containing protein [Georgenia subflava]|uniref:DUF3140 domain-containing protein n=1 Tax=Georgenia subflava TaxID=1622177 RepID=A0A6N7EFH5_9MICO|nr:DUF3140 domain-containing protein [Georgenia subflava]MPV36141.1 DUF3140 domain-containing protein [Georgenia subflava]
MADTVIDDELWDEFHALVNMNSQELRDWLATADAGEQSEAYTDQTGSERSRTVLEVLGKRRTDLSESDVATMRSVVDEIRAARGDEPEPTAGDTAWRHRLMSLGHDPLKPA